jgi:hypothetical protein
MTAAGLLALPLWIGSSPIRAQDSPPAQAKAAPDASARVGQTEPEKAAQDPATNDNPSEATIPTDTETKAHLDIYGAAMVDTGYNFKSINPNWFDVVRPTQLPSFKNEYGPDGSWFAGVRQSRLGFKGYMPTKLGELKTIFEFELFGTGVDAGQTTFRLRHAWGEIGMFGGGQTWSPFMDPDVFPNEIEYWGPTGMVFFRNVQVRFTPWQNGDSNFMIAVERPGASADQGVYADRIELQGVKPRFPMPDISGHYRLSGKKGHIQIAGIYRRIDWVDQTATPTKDLSGHADGWGINASSNVKLSKHVLRLQAVYGQGVENYMNDAPADVGVQNNFSNSKTPIIGKPLPVLGIVAFLDLNWSEKFTSTVGYSRIDIRNTSGQANDAFKSGQYAVVNMLYYPVKGVFLGPEFQFGYRDNKAQWHVPDYKIQFSAKYSFNFKVGG